MEIRKDVTKRATAIAVALIIAGVVLRLLPHPANFAPIGAIALFGGAVLPLRLAWWLPVAAMVVSDTFLGFHDTIMFTWSGFLLVALFGVALRNVNNWLRVPVGVLGSGIIFYVVSNFGVWASGTLYPTTLQGLVECYVAAIPFFKTSLLADFVYASVLFGAYALATRQRPAKVQEETA
jgi:hypothetical protein